VPLYEFHCQSCGSFDLRRDMQNASDVAPCPSCDQMARRVYSVAAIRLVSGPLRDATKAERQRLDRSRTGEPVVTGPLSGRRFPGRGDTTTEPCQLGQRTIRA